MTKVAKYVALSALFSIPVLVLYVAETSYFPFITGKGFMFRILVEIAAAAYIVLACVDARYRPRFSWTLALYAALTAWMFIADLLALNSHKAFWSNYERMDGWVTLIHVFLFFVVAGSILSVDKLWRKWWYTFITVSGFVCCYGLLQLAGAVEIHQSGVRLDATMGNSAYLAAYLLFALGITGWLAATAKGGVRYVLYILAALQVIILFNTATRGALLGVTLAAGLCALLWVLESGKKGKQLAAGALVALVVLVGAFFALRGTPVIENSPVLSRLSSISLAEGSTRFTLWTMAAEGVAARPVIGYGHEGFNYIFNTYYRPSLYNQEPWFDRAHNVFIDWLVWGGVPGFILFIALLGSGVLALYRSKASRAERIFFTSAIAAYAFQALFVFDNLFTYIPLAAILAMAHEASSRPIKKFESLPEVHGTQTTSVLASVATVAALVVIWVVNVPGMRAATDLVYAISPLPQGPSENKARFDKAIADNSFATQEIREQLVSYASSIVGNTTVPETLRIAFANLALDEMDAEIARAPHDARLYTQQAVMYRALGKGEEGLAQIDKALELSPKRQAFYLERATQLSELGRLSEARDALHTAYELDPSVTKLAAAAAAGDIFAGDVATGKALLLATYGTTTVNDQILIRAYYETKQYNELIATLRLAVLESGGEASDRYRLATALAIAGRFAEARTEANATIAAHPDTRAQGQAFLASLPK